MLISVEEARGLIAGAVTPGGQETVPLAGAAGRVLREPLRTQRPLPPFDRVMMDGVAVPAAAFAAGRRRFRVLGRIHAGEPARALTEAEACWWVMTGAVCPAGAGLVIPREYLREEAGGDSVEVVGDFVPPADGFIHSRGSDAASGAVLLPAGRRLDGPGLGAAASCGVGSVVVARVPRVALVSTGDELVEPGQALADHQIPRSNPYALAGLLRGHLVAEILQAHFPDERETLRAGLAALLGEADCILCSGGVSRGDRDFLPEVWRELGVETLFHGVAQRPGRPLWAGRAAGGALVLALPGNPVAALVGARHYAVPALRQWLGETPETPALGRLAAPFHFGPPLTCFLPVRREGDQVWPVPTRNSGDFVSLLGSDGYVVLPGVDRDDFPAGFAAPCFPW
jgi:molybdopterin molybdotransferase